MAKGTGSLPAPAIPALLCLPGRHSPGSQRSERHDGAERAAAAGRRSRSGGAVADQRRSRRGGAVADRRRSRSGGAAAAGRRSRSGGAAAEGPPRCRSVPGGRCCGRRTLRSGGTARDEASMGRTLVELFYDVISPYSWLAFEALCRYRHIWNIELRFRPAFLGGIMQQTGNKPPAMLPKRGEYLLKDMKRMAKYYQVPLRISPDAFQHIMGTSSLTAMRFITAIDMTNPQYLEPLSRQFWMCFWSQYEDISQPENILATARQAGLSEELSQKALEMASSPPVKDRLKDTTTEALKHGCVKATSLLPVVYLTVIWENKVDPLIPRTEPFFY
uniref:Glutathione S-transferase kappa 1 n=1 Tax=Junco hyemalis TaxID=40217 RepID=A0A8C5J5T7_JUNHY